MRTATTAQLLSSQKQLCAAVATTATLISHHPTTPTQLAASAWRNLSSLQLLPRYSCAQLQSRYSCAQLLPHEQAETPTQQADSALRNLSSLQLLSRNSCYHNSYLNFPLPCDSLKFPQLLLSCSWMLLQLHLPFSLSNHRWAHLLSNPALYFVPKKLVLTSS